MERLPRVGFFLQRTKVENAYQLVVVQLVVENAYQLVVFLDAVVPKQSQGDPHVHNYITKFGTRSERWWVGMVVEDRLKM
jgi:hypothetical protein